MYEAPLLFVSLGHFASGNGDQAITVLVTADEAFPSTLQEQRMRWHPLLCNVTNAHLLVETITIESKVLGNPTSEAVQVNSRI